MAYTKRKHLRPTNGQLRMPGHGTVSIVSRIMHGTCDILT